MQPDEFEKHDWTPHDFELVMLQLREMQFGDSSRYVEETHIDADDLMCAVLRKLGYGAGVAVYQSMTRWYS